MNKQLSQYLDLLRITAASLVLIAHITYPVFSDGRFFPHEELGHSSVMIFFVLSGYVITYVANEREFGFTDFAISRIARVYSVVLPALALTVCVDLLTLLLTPANHAEDLVSYVPVYQYASFPKYALMDVLFGNQIWGLSEPLFSNNVYWSMCFEVYYYCLFAAAFYFCGALRIALLVIVLACIGPWPLLRFHLWLFGAGIYLVHKQEIFITQTTARILFVLTVVLMSYDLATDLTLRIDSYWGIDGRAWHRFAGDTLTGIIIALNVFAARYCGFNFGHFGSWFTYLSSGSFSLYLMHGPLVRFFVGYFGPFEPLILISLVLGSVWLLSRVTERQKDVIRDWLRLLSVRILKVKKV